MRARHIVEEEPQSSQNSGKVGDRVWIDSKDTEWEFQLFDGKISSACTLGEFILGVGG